MSPLFSEILNLIRAIAAAIVAVGHLRGSFFTDYHSLHHSSQNIINFVIFFVTRLGMEAVIIFFVIGGFLVGGNTLIHISESKFKFSEYLNKRPRRKQRGIATLFLTFHAPQGAGNLPVILLNAFPESTSF